MGLSRRFLGGMAMALAALGLMLLAATPAHAALYAYSTQSTSSYTFTGGTLGSLIPESGSSAAQTGSPSGSDAHSGTSDVLQSYVGPNAGVVPQNTFTPKGATTPDYSRGDAALSVGSVGTFSTQNVAELDLANGTSSAASGSWAVTAPLVLTGPSAVSLGFAFTNMLALTDGGNGFVHAAYTYDMVVQDGNGTTLFDSAPTSVNQSIGLLAAGSFSHPGSGTLAITTGTLPTGTYTMTLTGTETVFANAVPEPASLSLLGCASLGLLRRARRTR